MLCDTYIYGRKKKAPIVLDLNLGRQNIGEFHAVRWTGLVQTILLGDQWKKDQLFVNEFVFEIYYNGLGWKQQPKQNKKTVSFATQRSEWKTEHRRQSKIIVMKYRMWVCEHRWYIEYYINSLSGIQHIVFRNICVCVRDRNICSTISTKHKDTCNLSIYTFVKAVATVNTFFVYFVSVCLCCDSSETNSAENDRKKREQKLEKQPSSKQP